MTIPDIRSQPRYKGRPILGLREGARLLLLYAVVFFAAEFCLSRLLVDADWIRDLISSVVSVCALVLPVAFLLSARGIAWETVFGRELGAGHGFWVILMAFFGMIATLGLQLLWFLALYGLGWDFLVPSAGEVSSTPLAVQVILIAGSAAVGEEIAMRGVLLPAFERRLGRGAAMVATSLIFALMHGDIAKLPVTFLLGLLLAHLTIRSGSLKASILYHFAHNTVTLALAKGLGGTAADTVEFSAMLAEPAMLPVLAVTAALVALFGGIFLFVFYRAFAHRCGKTSPALFREASPLGLTTLLCMILAAGFIGLRILFHTMGVWG